MAVELCPAPRISFSHGFCSSSPIFPMQQCSFPFMDSSINVDFEFDIRIDNIDEESYSSAEELFCNGKILPREIKKKITNIPSSKQELTQKQKPQPQAKITASSSKDIKKIDEEETNNNQNRSNGSSKSSFWRFKRSSSLNFVTGNKKKLCSNSSLSRSSSEGSAPKVKPFLQSSTNTQKSNLKKNNTCGYGYPAATINPILNVPLVDFFCVSSVFFNGKNKKKC
ncbi:hypothetical protein COLO4_09346 [Corchorus olitorius]|uniref:Uncharacterized protein n=1 Tax=Corchorus olitorius TaxID=93759 RepID=A0A1R3KCD0_9ROSI|nr:hypothetical protein COLO4_09346 [Corchorus olitorius]